MCRPSDRRPDDSYDVAKEGQQGRIEKLEFNVDDSICEEGGDKLAEHDEDPLEVDVGHAVVDMQLVQ